MVFTGVTRLRQNLQRISSCDIRCLANSRTNCLNEAWDLFLKFSKKVFQKFDLSKRDSGILYHDNCSTSLADESQLFNEIHGIHSATTFCSPMDTIISQLHIFKIFIMDGYITCRFVLMDEDVWTLASSIASFKLELKR